MIKYFINFITSIFLIYDTASLCIDRNTVKRSDSLFTFKEKVYDSTNFFHPGGQKYVQYIIGTDIEDILKLDELDFHLGKDWDKVNSILNSLYVSELSPICYTTTTTQSTTTQSTTTQSTKQQKKTLILTQNKLLQIFVTLKIGKMLNNFVAIALF